MLNHFWNENDAYEVSTWVTVTILYFFAETAALISSLEGWAPIGAAKIVILAP